MKKLDFIGDTGKKLPTRNMIYFRSMSIVFLGFIMIVPIGTIAHEFGHILMATAFGFETELFYASSVHYGESSVAINPEWIEFLIDLAGPLSTIIVSLIGLFLLNRCKSIHKIGFDHVPFYTLLVLLLCLFLSREIFIFLSIIMGKGYMNTDEFKIAEFIALDPGLFSAVIAMFAFSVCTYSVLKLVKQNFLPWFLLSGIAGSILGFFIWMHVLGPVLLPE